MGKNPAFQFYPGDWRRDTQVQMASMETRGVWIEMLCCMWDAPDRGKLTGDIQSLSRLLGCETNVLTRSLVEIERYKIGDVITNGNDITIINRRMSRDDKKLNSNRDRQRRLREKGGGDPQRWTAIRIPILERDEYMCAYCGRKAETVDHVFPKSRGGIEDPENLVACCKRCNQRKQSRTLEEAGMSFWKGFDKTSLKYNTKITPPSSSSPSSSPSNKEPFVETSNEVRLSQLLLSLIVERKHTFKKPDLQKWAVHVHRMIRLDNRRPDIIAKVIKWAQADTDFWQNNILSTEKLRKQFDQLEMKMEKERGDTDPEESEAYKQYAKSKGEN